MYNGGSGKTTNNTYIILSINCRWRDNKDMIINGLEITVAAEEAN